MTPPARGPAVHSLVDHLFRRESGKMVSVLTRVFGPANLDLAEDVVQETLARALAQWPLGGVPDNPAAWLYQAAKNRAIDVLRREERFRHFAPELTHALASTPAAHLIDDLFGERHIEDDTLRMIFTCCHPGLPLELQIALTLKILCGFSSAEIARAFLTQDATIQKRLYRARLKIKEERLGFEVPPAAELPSRRQAVLSVLYLMFNEGYNASVAEQPIRRDVCLEAMRLCKLLTEHPSGRHPAAFALLALMCLHAARFDARLDGDGNLLTLKHQDRARWNRPLIAEGFRCLDLSASGDELTEMHLEAGIAGMHAAADAYQDTDWHGILKLYDLLLTVKPSPIVALNRAIALAECHGPRAGLDALASIPADVLDGYYLFWATRGELHLRLGEYDRAAPSFTRAIALTSSPAERQFLQGKLQICQRS